jgi:hypothetical protein
MHFSVTLPLTHASKYHDEGSMDYKTILFFVFYSSSASYYNFVGLNLERAYAVTWPAR